jgi:hypothetical protein
MMRSQVSASTSNKSSRWLSDPIRGPRARRNVQTIDLGAASRALVIGAAFADTTKTLGARTLTFATRYWLAREANQDRCQGRQPWPLRHVPDGRGGGSAADVRRNPLVDRPVAGTTGASMNGAGVRSGRPRWERRVWMLAMRSVPAPRRSQLVELDSCRARGNRFTIAQDARSRDPGPKTQPDRGMSV